MTQDKVYMAADMASFKIWELQSHITHGKSHVRRLGLDCKTNKDL